MTNENSCNGHKYTTWDQANTAITIKVRQPDFKRAYHAGRRLVPARCTKCGKYYISIEKAPKPPVEEIKERERAAAS